MKEEKQKVSISNFLYVDRDKIASFYAQMFGNHPLQLEISKSENEEQNIKIAGTIGVINGNFLSKDNIRSEFKKVVDPHDAKTVDVIAKLLELNKKNLLLVNGSLFLWDKVALEMFRKSLEFIFENPNLQESLLREMMQAVQNNPSLQKELIEDPSNLKEIIKLFINLLSESGLEAIFFLKGYDGNLYGGTINPKFLTEPITSFHFKHGGNWLDNIILIGIEEKSSPMEFPNENENFMNFITEILPAISSFIFPRQTIKVSPIAMFTIIGELEK